jgi:predicted TPR repeat methyltransferase
LKELRFFVNISNDYKKNNSLLVRHQIQFPKKSSSKLNQDQTFFFIQEGSVKKKLRFHDYGEIYSRPGLYEQLFYERLKCASPTKVAQILESSIHNYKSNFNELRVLDLGAGNGVMGEELKKRGVARLVGVDISKEASEATIRDRPGVYDSYYVQNFAKIAKDKFEDINSWQFNCMVSVAALGFGDIPTSAFMNAVKMIEQGGWIAFNIRDTFLDRSDSSGFSKIIRRLISTNYFEILHVEKYRHRLSIEGKPLFYFALVVRKNS